MERAKRFYRTHPVEFIEDWCDTFDPRNAGTAAPTTMPFRLFSRQRQFIEFLHQCYQHEAHGLVEKSRDMGATWLCVSYSVWLFLFVKGARVGWGSRKAANVDKIGDMDSIFEKIRFQMRTMPRCFWPDNFTEDNMAFMKVYTPGTNGASITGESGDDIGRGGRTRIYFKDESAHYEHPEAIEAALSDTTRVQFDLSSVNGMGNVFHRKRENGVDWLPGGMVQKGKTNVFVMDWRDHPAKTQDWYDERRSKFTDDGLLHVFAQEVDRNYAASVEGVVIPAEWVASAIDAHVVLDVPEDGWGLSDWGAALDVADEGGDRNAIAIRRGIVLREVREWGARDTAITARKAIEACSGKGHMNMQYDCIGVGAGVKAEINRLSDDDLLPRELSFTAWNAGAAVLDPDRRIDPDDYDTPLNKDFYQNLKSQAWWQVRRRFERTHNAVQLHREGKPHNYPPSDLISLSSEMPLLRTLQKELSQPTMGKSTKMKLLIDKKPDGTKSPNLADAVIMCFWPVDGGYDTSLNWVS
jgi:phage terminase large subunit